MPDHGGIFYRPGLLPITLVQVIMVEQDQFDILHPRIPRLFPGCYRSLAVLNGLMLLFGRIQETGLSS